jgi:hypothetical protein
LHIEG